MSGNDTDDPQCGVTTIEIADSKHNHPQLQEPAIDECNARRYSSCDDCRE